MTNKKFREDSIFVKSCELANTDPTTRQASKFRLKKGSAYKYKHQAANIVSGKEQ